MLLRNNVQIIEKAIVNLYFDNNEEKHIEVAEKDVISVRYNDKGFAREITGKVSKIANRRTDCSNDTMRGYSPERYGGYFVVDSSSTYNGMRVYVFFDHILDLSIIEKYDETLYVKTESAYPVTKIRVIDGILQVFNKDSYKNVVDLLGEPTPNKPSEEEPDTPTVDEESKADKIRVEDGVLQVYVNGEWVTAASLLGEEFINLMMASCITAVKHLPDEMKPDLMDDEDLENQREPE